MTVTIKSEHIGDHYIDVSQEKFSKAYKVGIYQNAGLYYIAQDERMYGTMKQANRRYNALLKQVTEGKW